MLKKELICYNLLYLLAYNIFLYSYLAAIRLAALFNPKANAWVQGRKNLYTELRQLSIPEKSIWMHCASLGEFEQGRPLLEELRRKYPEKILVLSFFSPSGYEIRKDFSGVDHVFYLPLGGYSTSRSFVRALNPEMVLWVKYDYWYHYLASLYAMKIPVYLISASFRRNQAFFAWYGKLHRNMLGFFRHLFVQTENSKRLLEGILPPEKISVGGDTRFDRVLKIASEAREIKGISDFIGDKLTIIAGSTWPVDIEELDHFANSRRDIQFVIAPHEIDEENLKEIKKLMPQSVCYSEWLAGKPADNVLIIDNIGMLSHLYRYGSIAYIGGGFGDDGVHNVLEAAVFGIPVVFGPVFDKYIEAIDLLEESAACTVESALELESCFERLLQDQELRNTMGEAAKNYVKRKAGATEKILEYIDKELVKKIDA